MKIYFYSLFIFLLIRSSFSCTYAQSDGNVIDEVIWLVGDEAILRSDVETMRMQMQFEGSSLQGDPYCTLPEQIAVQKLYLHQAKLDSIDVSDGQIVQELERRINYAINNTGSKEKLEEYLKKPLTKIREEWRQNLKEMYAVKLMQEKLVKNVKVTPGDVRNFYNKIPKDSLPYIETTVEVEIVTQEPLIPIEEIDDIKRRLREYTEQVTSGKTQFSSLARLWSEDRGSAMQGGELGFLGRTSLMPEFAAVAFDLNDPNRVSRIVETEAGFHIIQLIEKRGDRINVRHILLRPRVSKEDLNQAVNRLDSIRTDILENKFTFDEAATYISYDKDTKNNKGLMVNKDLDSYSERTGTSRFQMSELPMEIAMAIKDLQVGEISKPFTMVNARQKEIAAFVRLKSRVTGHKANLTDDFQALRAMTEEKKKEEILNKWIAKKQKETFIRINDNWKNCDFQRNGWIQ